MYCIDELLNWQYEHRDHKQAAKRNLTPRICRRKAEEVKYPFGKTDQYEDQSKDILNSILKDEPSDSDSVALIEELWADEVL